MYSVAWFPLMALYASIALYTLQIKPLLDKNTRKH